MHSAEIYIKGTLKTIAHIIEPYNIRVAHKLIPTLRQQLTNQRTNEEQFIRSNAATGRPTI